MANTPLIERARLPRLLKCAFDLNDVLRDTTPKKLHIVRSHLSEQGHPPSQIRKRTRSPRELARAHGMTDEEYDDLMSPLYVGEESLSIRAHAGAKECLELLLRDGHFVAVATSAGDKAVETGKRWISHRKLDIPVLGSGRGNPDKSEILQGFDVAADNEFEKLHFLDGTVPHRILFRPDWPMWMSIPDFSVILVQSWGEMYRTIKNIART